MTLPATAHILTGKMNPDEREAPQPSPIERLSVELVRMILLAMPDVVTLQKAVISCPLFYNAFLEVEKSISTHLLSINVDKDVLPEAVAALESSKVRNSHKGMKDIDCREAVIDYAARNLRQRPTPPTSWTLDEALCLERLHVSVDWFANKFATAALAKDPLNRTHTSVTPQEKARFQRALYRFEIYCNLFREVKRVQSPFYPDQKTLFFSNFAPWEIEQIGCVHDYLIRAIIPAFTEIAEHEVTWGVYQVDYTPSVDNPTLQHQLSLGLNKLHQIAQAETYEERHKVLYTDGHPGFVYYFLYEGLQAANENNNDIWPDELTTDSEILQMRPPYYADSDRGPMDVWRWAYDEDTWGSWVYQEVKSNLRQWGYVMWDRSRLETTGIFEKPWEDTRDPHELLLERQEAMRQEAYMENSWDQRRDVNRQGGDGWWCLGDESKLEWRNGPPPKVQMGGASQPNWVSPFPPRSLEEAREILSSMKLPSSVK